VFTAICSSSSSGSELVSVQILSSCTTQSLR